MENLLSGASFDELAQCIHSDCKRVLFAFDYDGTLAPIVRHFKKARMRPTTRKWLKRLTAKHACAVVSGRALVDLREIVGQIPFQAWSGNHGMEVQCDGRKNHPPRVHPRVIQWKKILEQELACWEGLSIEDKGLSLSIHFRQARRKAAAKQAIQAALRKLRGSRVIGGKDVFNVLPAQAGGKGRALLAIMKALDCSCALYFGDDLTDEEVFRLPRKHQIFGVHVGRNPASRAQWFIHDQVAMDLALKRLTLSPRLTTED